MAAISPDRQFNAGAINPVDSQPKSGEASSPKRNVLVNFSRTMRSFSLGTHPDLKAGNKIDFVATFVKTGSVRNALPVVGPEDGQLFDNQKRIPFSREDQDGFSPAFSVGVPSTSADGAFLLEGKITRESGLEEKWGEAIEFTPVNGRGLSSVTVRLDLGGEDVALTGAIDATARERIEDCLTATAGYASEAKTAAYDRSVDCWDSITQTASSAWASARERLTGQVVVPDPKDDVK